VRGGDVVCYHYVIYWYRCITSWCSCMNH